MDRVKYTVSHYYEKCGYNYVKICDFKTTCNHMKASRIFIFANIILYMSGQSAETLHAQLLNELLIMFVLITFCFFHTVKFYGDISFKTMHELTKNF